MTQLIRSACLSDFVEVARSAGLEPFRMLDAVGLPRSCLKDPDIKIPTHAVGRLLEISAKAAKIEDFGLRLAERRQLSNLGPVGLIAREQPTVGKAIEALIDYIRLHNQSMSLRVEEIDDQVLIRPELARRRPEPMRQSVELTIAVLYRTLKMFLGSAWKPTSISFMHSAPKDRRVYSRIFGTAKIQFDQDFNGIICTVRDLRAPIPTADPAMARYVQRYLDGLAEKASLTLTDRVRELVWATLSSGNCSIEHATAHLGCDRRTLHRRLARERTSYSEIVDAVRAEMASRFMADSNQSMTVVADMLGFSALSAYSRWFHRKFGCSPSAWRSRQRDPAV